MKSIKRVVIASLVLTFLAIPNLARAATSPDLGAASTFAILSNTYTNTAAGTTINGDLGYTTPPAVNPTVNGSTNPPSYSTAGTDQGSALVALNNEPCTFTFDPGAIDLASNTDFPTNVYEPGVYCIDGAATIGGGETITLSGSGTYIFRMDGALTTSAGSIVILADGAAACDVWWTPTAATTLGANSTFIGTVIADAGITIGSTVNWIGRALAFGGTVSTDADTVTVPDDCSVIPPDDEEEDPDAEEGSGDSTVPGLPQTGSVEQTRNISWIVLLIVISIITATIYASRRKTSRQ